MRTIVSLPCLPEFFDSLFILKITQSEFGPYKLHLVCIDENGNKYYIDYTSLLFIDIRFDTNNIPLLNANRTNCCEIEKIQLYPFEYYASDKELFYRCYFDNLRSYKNFYFSYKKSGEKLYEDENPRTYYNKCIQYDSNLHYYPSNIPLLEMTWDIEVYPSDKSDMPISSKISDDIFLIAGSFHYSERLPDSELPIRSYIISSIPIDINELQSLDGLYLKVVSKEYYLILEFIELLNIMHPDVIIGFNDFCFDWVYLRDRIIYHYPDLAYKFYRVFNNFSGFEASNRMLFKETLMKISPEDELQKSIYPVSDNTIFIDCRVHFRRLHPKEPKSSLNFFLTLYGLESKDDLPYHELFKIYENKDPKSGAIAAKYCYIDSFRTYQLLTKKGIVKEAIKMSEIAHISLEESLNRANGFKVFKTLVRYGKDEFAFQYGKNTSESNYNENNYVGGYVSDPIFGFNWRSPVVGLDFASLYPSIIRTYNLSPDKICKKEDGKCHTFTIKDNVIHILDHNNEKIGLIPKILGDLYNIRLSLKKELSALKNKRERGDFYDKSRLDDLNQKQSAVKVLMNSFYGILGSPTSGALYQPMLAEIITTVGRALIQEANSVILKNGYKIWYNDTDSCYLSLRDDAFTSLETDFINNKIDIEELVRKKIEITKTSISNLQSIVNNHMKEYSKYDYLTMSYEEVLYPVFFLKKKIYIGIEHMNTINPIDVNKYLFVRGFSLVRRNTTGLTKYVLRDMFLNKLFSSQTLVDAHVNHGINMQHMVLNTIVDLINNFEKLDISYFIKNDKYSPKKNNIRINQFVSRMKEFSDSLISDEMKKKYRPPEGGSRFEYIYVEKDKVVLTDGRIYSPTGLSNLMEYPSYLNDFNGKICYSKYFESELSNELGGFIDSKQGKSYVNHCFNLLHSNCYDINDIIDYEIGSLLKIKNTVKDRKRNELKIESKEKKNIYDNLLEDIITHFNLSPFFIHFLSCPEEFVNRIEKICKTYNYDAYHLIREKLYTKYYRNRYRIPILDDLTSRQNEILSYNLIILNSMVGDYIKNHHTHVQKLLKEVLNLETSIDSLYEYITDLDLNHIDQIIQQYVSTFMKFHLRKEYILHVDYIKKN